MTYKLKTILILIIIFIIVSIGIIFYIALRNTSKDVSNKEPYKFVINKKVITVEDAILIENSNQEFTKEYPNELHDCKTIDTSQVKFATIPKGSILEFKKAFEVHHAVSGSTFVFLLGNLTNIETDEKKAILYHWPTLKIICLEEPCNYWEFKKAPWQTTINKTKYFN